MTALFSCFACGRSDTALRCVRGLGLFCPRCDIGGKTGRYTAEEEAALIDFAVRRGWEESWQVYLGERDCWRLVRGRTVKSATRALRRLLEWKSLEPWKWADACGAEMLDYGVMAGKSLSA